MGGELSPMCPLKRGWGDISDAHTKWDIYVGAPPKNTIENIVKGK